MTFQFHSAGEQVLDGEKTYWERRKRMGKKVVGGRKVDCERGKRITKYCKSVPYYWKVWVYCELMDCKRESQHRNVK